MSSKAFEFLVLIDITACEVNSLRKGVIWLWRLEHYKRPSLQKENHKKSQQKIKVAFWYKMICWLHNERRNKKSMTLKSRVRCLRLSFFVACLSRSMEGNARLNLTICAREVNCQWERKRSALKNLFWNRVWQFSLLKSDTD